MNEPCEFCQLRDGAHASTCALLLLARDLEIHAPPVVVFYPSSVYDASDFGARPDEGRRADFWPDTFREF